MAYRPTDIGGGEHHLARLAVAPRLHRLRHRHRVAADIALYAFRLAGGPGRIDHVGGVLGQQSFPRAQGAVDRHRQGPGGPRRHAVQAHIGAGDQPLGARILQTDQHAVGRRVGFERQPGRAGFGDGRLHHQQVRAAR
ncbi:hypothetical protein G6F22_018724 [Rhizopus arrhizus]|nr:hypothetical protein G6F22_018724 [Rhizopus arrhizus]